jgi:hypothetical protein
VNLSLILPSGSGSIGILDIQAITNSSISSESRRSRSDEATPRGC